MNDSNFIVPEKYIDNENESLDVKLKEISHLIFQIFDFVSNGRNKFITTVFPYEFSFVKNKNNHWLLISCKVKNEKEQSITFSFASSTDGSSFQNCSGLYNGNVLTQDDLIKWLKDNPTFLSTLKEKKLSYKNNFTSIL